MWQLFYLVWLCCEVFLIALCSSANINEAPSKASILFPGDNAPGADRGPPVAGVGASLQPGVRHEPGNLLVFPRENQLPRVECVTVAGETGLCRLLVQCAIFHSELGKLAQSPCSITEELQGVCCPVVDHPTKDALSITQKAPLPGIAPPKVEEHQITFAIEQSQTQQQARNEKERHLEFNNIIAQSGTPVFLHARLFETSPEVIHQSQNATLALGATLNLAQSLGLNKQQAEFGLSSFSVANTIIADTCPQEPVCPETKYRTVDGSCNNLKHKHWGQAATAYNRLVPPDYEDGVNLPRSSVSSSLPSPRLISQKLTVPQDELYSEYSLMLMEWGQFVDHDITHTPISRGPGFDITCCSQGTFRPEDELHPECFPIMVPKEDSFFVQFGLQCLDFSRSMPAIRPDCRFGPREQMNQITGYLDGSNIYGSTSAVATNLREGRGGRLRTTRLDDGRELLPEDPQALGCRATRPFCFRAGDVRVNEQPDLVVVHTIWHRQHNKVVAELARLNPSWNDEILYQEGRRIVTAQYQHVTYNEYLPIVLGTNFMVTFGLSPLTSGSANTYRPDVDASILNEFATAAFRYGHSLIPKSLQSVTKFGQIDRDIPISKAAFNPSFLYEKGSIDSMLRGLTTQGSQRFDGQFTTEITNLLFAGNGSRGLDLVALNIQRGRDHGLPSYNKIRVACKLPPAKTFSDFADTMGPQEISLLSSLYADVNDVDLYVAGLIETPIKGSILGHTYLCIIGNQFARLKIGDRFFYENGGLKSSFSDAQLEQIRRTSLARIICDNSDEIDIIQPLAFLQASVTNRRVSCSDDKIIPRLSLDPWTNEPV